MIDSLILSTQKRKKRSTDNIVAATRKAKSSNKSKVHIYESYESKKTGTPQKNVVTESIHKARVVAVPPPENFDPEIPVADPPKRRGKGLYRRPGFSKDRSEEKSQKLVENEAAELSDLADDSFFFAQLKKNNKKKNKRKSKKNKKKSHSSRKHSDDFDKDVVFVQSDGTAKSERLTKADSAQEVDYLANDNDNDNEYQEVDETPDYYENDDYRAAEVDSEKADVEDVNPDYEIIEVETEPPVKRVKPRPKPKAKLKPKSKRRRRPRPVEVPQPEDPIEHEKRFHYTEIINIHPKKKSIRPKPIHNVQHEQTNNIVETKKFHHPEQLYTEIGKIFDQKQRNYARRGHDKTHWELRILPRHYDDYDY